ncbi:MAG TPA: Ycf66 family protein [Candidatus Obscuribacterales bacterium]
MNFGTPVPLLIGIVLILGAVALFFLDKLKPGYGRDADKVYAILWLISGVFLLGHLTMELLASFQQLLLVGMLIAVTIENVYSRSPKEDRYAAQNAGDGGRDYYRPSRAPEPPPRSRMNVRAELDNEGPYRPRFPEDRRMLGGQDEGATRRGGGYYDEGYGDRYSNDRGGYGDRPERPVERLNPSGDRIRRRRPKSVDGRYGADTPSRGWDESASGYAANSGGYSANAPTPPSTAYPRASNGRDDDSYVDYRPVDYPNSTDYPSDDAGKSAPDYGNRY